mgnify:CR=1 FL=1|jgi:hypothetical protein
MKIPEGFPDDLIDYIYSFIYYPKDKLLLNDIITYTKTKKNINIYISKWNNSYESQYELIPIGLFNKIFLKFNNLKVPLPILYNYNDNMYFKTNIKLMINLLIARNPNRRSEIDILFKKSLIK